MIAAAIVHDGSDAKSIPMRNADSGGRVIVTVRNAMQRHAPRAKVPNSIALRHIAPPIGVARNSSRRFAPPSTNPQQSQSHNAAAASIHGTFGDSLTFAMTASSGGVT